MVIIDHVIEAIHRVTWERYEPPAVLRCSPDIPDELAAERYRRPDSLYAMGSPDYPLGMRLVVDKYLPRGVWRLCDADQTLLYDCREGTSAL